MAKRRIQIYPYPSNDQLENLQLAVDRDEAQRSRKIYQFLTHVDRDKRKLWIMLCYPLLKDEERAKILGR